MKNNNFIESELIPLEAPKNIKIEELKRINAQGLKTPILWAVYQYGKLRTINMPHPSLFNTLKSEWSDIENSIIEWFKNNSNSCHQYITGQRKNKTKKDIKDNISHRYFLFNKQIKYGDLKTKAFKELKDNEYVSYIDISNFFGSIYIHSIEWALYKCKKVQEVKAIEKEQINKEYRKIHDFILNLSSRQTNGLPVGPNISIILSNIISNKVDTVIKNTLRDNNIKKVKIFRFIDDIYIRHSNKISEELLDIIEQKLIYYNIKFNKNEKKRKLNQKENPLFNWENLILCEPEMIFTGIATKLANYCSKKNRTNKKILSILKEGKTILNKQIKKTNGLFLKKLKPNSWTHILKSYLRLYKDNNNFKICVEIENISLLIWKAILRFHKNNPIVLNSFSPLLYILRKDARQKSKKLQERIIKFSQNDSVKENSNKLFSFILYFYELDKLKASKLLENGYLVKNITKNSEEEMIKLIDEPYKY